IELTHWICCSCAGVCSYEGRGGLCSIRISEPLLKLRPRRDLIETLLHEMIHALLFVTNNDKDHESHGPEFCKHMRRINRMSGANVTIYHNFHDEVDEYRQHWWRCDGPCQNRRPYFGYVKRAMNRAPSARDPWWAEHQQTCGGTYSKVKEPENYKVKKGKHREKPGKLSKSPKEGNGSLGKSPGMDSRPVIPFNGKGHVLGGGSTELVSQRTPLGKIPESSRLLSPPSQFVSLGHESGSRPWNVKSNEQKSTSQAASLSDPVPLNAVSPSVLTGWLLKNPSDYTSPKTPKRSVSNNRAFVNINGSPVRIGRTKPINSTKDPVLKSGQKWSVTELHRTPRPLGQSATGASAKKRTCIEPSFPGESIIHAFERSPAQRQGQQSTKASGSVEADSSDWQSQNVMGAPVSQMGSLDIVPVDCPVCNSAILPSEINQHLDSCLQPLGVGNGEHTAICM
ncbi:DNA-dependent metalloprotease SPRTN, partial [Rhincodon typus]|uniref:DNA-dependent metalloprotease SPRTN n=1 Tax=Rhincodon typus TaxID=259920 RepID=UPI00202E56E5